MTNRHTAEATLRLMRANLRTEILLALVNLVLSLAYHYTLMTLPLSWADLLILWAPGALYFVRSFTDSFVAYSAERAGIDVLTVQMHLDAEARDRDKL